MPLCDVNSDFQLYIGGLSVIENLNHFLFWLCNVLKSLMCDSEMAWSLLCSFNITVVHFHQFCMWSQKNIFLSFWYNFNHWWTNPQQCLLKMHLSHVWFFSHLLWFWVCVVSCIAFVESFTLKLSLVTMWSYL